jgi:1-deoxy-D-xylulose-5-phosphate reductoisomerase
LGLTEKIFIAGSTGSIGTQTLNICKKHNIEVTGISARDSVSVLARQALEFSVKKVHILNEKRYRELKSLLPPEIQVFAGENILPDLIFDDRSDTLLNAVVGSAGLAPTVAGIKSGKKIALANKETITCAGGLIMELAKKHNSVIFPVDSEHSAIFQCLQGNNHNEVKRIILTASGGPFFGKTDLSGITASDALKHPNWAMGRKITIDSATLMNKGLEVIEAHWLFGGKPIHVVIHRESIIHSMVEFRDNAVMAQLGAPDMAIPIQLALTWPNRLESLANPIDFTKISNLTFAEPDTNVFRCLKLARQALQAGGTMPCVLNGANETAVSLFLDGKINFPQIPKIIENTMSAYNNKTDYTLEDVFAADVWAKDYAIHNS